MEPAAERREHGTVTGGKNGDNWVPQWSPPAIGGNTGWFKDLFLTQVNTAMEPASDQREYTIPVPVVRTPPLPQWSRL